MVPVLHRGVVTAGGFHFDDGALPEEERRRRVLRLVETGAHVVRTPYGLLVRLASPLEVRCAEAPGTPLVAAGHGLSAVEGPAVTGAAVVLARAGETVRVPMGALEPVDPSSWLDLADWRVLPATPLAAPPPPPLACGDDAPPHVELKHPPPSDAVKEVTAPWSERRPGMPPGVIGRLLERLHGARRAAADDALLGDLYEAARSHLPDPRTAAAAARQNAEYLRALMGKLQGGDVDDILRHALPLEDPRDPRPLLPLVGLIRPRPRVEVGGARPASLRGLGIPSHLAQALRTAYQGLLQRLRDEARVDEACFVLAELLQDPEGAVALLEQSGRRRAAAELAEARRLPPGLVVRLWFQEGEVARAVRIARRTGAFADAVRRLEAVAPAVADELREQWARTLTSSGDYEAAVRVAWPLAGLHQNGEIWSWMARVVEDGGPPGARVLVQALAAEGPAAARRRYLEVGLELLRDGREVVQPSREALVEALAALEQGTPGTARLASEAVRAAAREAAGGHLRLERKTFERLLAATGDPVLRADMPPWSDPVRASLLARSGPSEIVLDACGTVAVHDAALLPDGRVLAALGEAGLRLMSGEGRTVMHLDVPAHRLVVSDAGTRAIAIGLRGRVQRLWRVDLQARRATRWCEASLQAWADDYDGSQWFAAHLEPDDTGTLFSVDALAPGLEALNPVARTHGRVVSVARAGGTCAFVVASDGFPVSLWCARYVMASGVDERDLENRLPTPLWFPNAGVAVAPDGGCALLMAEAAPRDRAYGRAALKTRSADRWSELPLRGPADIGRVLGGPSPLQARWNSDDYGDGAPWPADEGPPPPPWSGEAWTPRPVASHDFVAGPLRLSGGIVIPLIDRTLGGEALRLYLRGARQAAVRLTRRHLVVCDGRGRIAAVDTRTGRITRQLTVSF